jgi:pimeloyl-ACP methyl ester carboxylesterase
MRQWFLLLIAPLFGSCSFLPRKAVAPVPVDTAPATMPPASEMLVLLPGRLEGPRAFRQRGVFEQVARLRPKAAIAAPDLHFAYYKERTAVGRLREDVILPARKKGGRITLAGVSLGGLGSLFYALEYPEEVDEILLFAPFVGDPEVIDEIRAAGGLRKWRPGPLEDDDFQRKLWRNIRDRWVLGGEAPRIRLAIGRDDRLLYGSRLLRDELIPAGDYFEVEGGHGWKAWREAFEILLPPAPGS